MNQKKSGQHPTATKRMACAVVVAYKKESLPLLTSPNTLLASNKNRVVFRYALQEDVVKSRFMEAIVTRICERLPVALGTIDKKLQEFIISTASRHAGISTHTLPPANITTPPKAATAMVETTVSVLFQDSFNTSNRATVQEKAIRFPLQRVPVRKPPQTPPIFKLPADPKLPANSGLTQVAIQRAIKTIQWVQSHVHMKVFENEHEFDGFVEFLIQMICLADEEVPAHGGLFTMSQTRGKGYFLRPASTNHNLSVIELPDNNASFVRTIERLQTVFLRTGHFGQAWDDACHRADIEFQMSQEEGNEFYLSNKCNCALAERQSTLHMCDNCKQPGLCAGQYHSSTQGTAPRILCSDCMSGDVVAGIVETRGFGQIECTQCANSTMILYGSVGPDGMTTPICSKCTTQQTPGQKCEYCQKNGKECRFESGKSGCKGSCQHCKPIDTAYTFTVRCIINGDYTNNTRIASGSH